MPDLTARRGYKKPLDGEDASITVLNGNMDQLDSDVFPSVASLAALVALLPNVPEGAIVSVLPTSLGGFLLYQSVWMKTGGQWRPAPGMVLLTNTTNNTDFYAVANALFSFQQANSAAMTWGVGTRFQDANGVQLRWCGTSKWIIWNWVGVPLNTYGYYNGGSSSIGDGTTYLSVAEGVVTFNLACYRSTMGLDTSYFVLVGQFIPPGIFRTTGYSSNAGASRTAMAARIDNGGNVAWDGNNGLPLDRWYGTFSYPINQN